MDTCVVCGGVEFYTESGFYFCQQCETQQEGRREAIVEYTADASTYVTKKKIERPRKVAADAKEASLGWTSWEAFNIILHGWTSELIMLGASPELKITVLQLWTTYLGKLEVAFRSFHDQSLPRLPIVYRKKDSEIVYGEVSSRVRRKWKKKESSATSDGESTHASEISFGRLLSQRRKKLIDMEYKKFLDSSESDTDAASSANQSVHSIKSDVLQSKKKRKPRIYFNKLARAHKKTTKLETTKLPLRERAAARNAKLVTHKHSVEHLTLPDVMAVIILALRINDEKIHLSDMIRFQLEGHLSTRKLGHFFPADEPLPKDLRCTYSVNNYEASRKTASNLALLLGVTHIPEPNIVELIRRYCTELQLPNGMALYAERMIAISPPKLTFEKWNKELPRYEAKAMSVILIMMKMLFGLDGVTEYEISRVVNKINFALITNQSAAVDAVEDALWWLENDEFLNCGYGCSPNEQNIVEIDASMMNGTTMQCGTVLGLKDVEHPISVARYVMENYRNKIFSNELMKRMKNIPRFWMSPGNMDPICERKNEVKNQSCGCISWDGENLVVGSTGGGPRGNRSGAISDAGIIGSGLFASDAIACAITGPMSSLIKLNLASEIIAEAEQLESCIERTLKKRIDDMWKESDVTAGGIILHSSGCAGVYFTAPRMPYAVVKNECIVYGWDMCNRHYRRKAEENDALDSKLFNFIEWQRYIECRRTVITSQHSATKFRLDPESPCQNISECLSYLNKFITPGEHVDIVRRNQLLTDAMDQNMANLAENLPEMEAAKIFEPSLTPMHSYLQQLLKDDEMDLPSILKQDFSSTKIGYMTNTETFKELARECGIDLKIIDSSANFLERIIPTAGSEFIDPNQAKQSEPTPVVVPIRRIKKCDDPLEYMHLKNTGKIYIDKKKHSLYKKRLEHSHQTKRQMETDFDDFVFEQVRSNGKLNIVEFADDSDSDDEMNQPQVFNDENMLLSNFERQSMKGGISSHWHSKQKRYTLHRPKKGCDCIMCSVHIESSDELKPRKKSKSLITNANEDNEKNHQRNDVTIIEDDEDNEDDVTIVNKVSNNTSNADEEEISILREKTNGTKRETETFFRPYKDYWLNRMTTRNDDSDTLIRWHMLIERDLPVNFRWMLNECAKMIEVDISTLYHELAIMELYYTNSFVKNYDEKRDEKFYNSLVYRSKKVTQSSTYKWINTYGLNGQK